MHQSITIHATENGKFALAKPHDLEKLNPKELLLYSTALCAGMTTLSIAEKERVKLLKLEIKMSGELDTEKVEGKSQYVSFDIAYNIECKHIDEQSKVSNAVRLATDKYCGGLAMLRKIAPVSHSISIVSVEVE
ncbi:MAG: OsmC family protein [Alistipes sp.]|nr:OsmC family protein [Alistipes sp.]